MTWFKCGGGGGGIPAILKSLMNSVFNKKFGTAEIYPPEAWPDTVNLMGPLEEKTVSGSVVAFSDGADDVPLKNCIATVDANLSGVSSVDVVQMGKNLISAPEYTNNTSTMCLDLGKDMTFPSVVLSFLATNAIADATNAALVDFKKDDDTHQYRTLNAFKDANNNAFQANTQQNGIFSNTFSNVTFRYIIIYYLKNNYSKFSTDCLSDWQLEVGSTVSEYEPINGETHTANLGRTIYGGSVDVVNGTGSETWRKIVIDGDTVKCNGIYGANGNALPRLIMDAEYYHSGVATDILSTYLTPSSSVINDEDSIALVSSGTSIAVHIGTIQGNDGTHGYNSSAELLTAANAYLQSHNLTVVYKLSDANATDFTFTPVPILSRLGDNTMLSDGDLSVIYRSSGTQTLIPPTLISKTVTENGTYSAEDDGVDGYDEVTVNVPTGATNVETVLGENPLIELNGVTGTDVSRVMWTRTAATAEKVIFHPNTKVKTNTGSNEGYFKVLKNSEVIASTYSNTSSTTAFSIPDVVLSPGDVIEVIGGFDNYHTSAWFELYSTITVVS